MFTCVLGMIIFFNFTKMFTVCVGIDYFLHVKFIVFER
jgi:hypothetical protein